MRDARTCILLVEDEALIALQEKKQLERAGYAVIHVFDGQTAISTVSAGPGNIDLILMDIDLGKGIDGTEAAREILNRFDLPLLFLSGHQEDDIVARTESITNYGYVVKSSVFTVLHASIKMAFKLFATKKQLDLNSLEIENANEQLKSTLRDLTAAHADLQLSENKFSKVFHLNPDYMSISTLADGVYIDVNDGFTAMTGYRRDEVLGCSALSDHIDLWVDPGRRARLVQELLDHGEIINFDLELRRKDRSTFRGLADGRVIDLDGEK